MSVHTEQLTEEFLGQFQVGVRQTVTIIPYWFIPNFQSLLTRTVLTPEIVRLALYFKVLLNEVWLPTTSLRVTVHVIKLLF